MFRCVLARVRANIVTAYSAAILFSLLSWPSAARANITVTSLADSGAGSLRAAIAAAAATDTIDFAVTGAITLTTGELLLNKNLTITGPGARDLSVSGNLASRVFNVQVGKTVTMSGLTVADGRNAGTGGGFINNGTLTLVDVTVTNNGDCGIHNQGGTLKLTGCTVINNFGTVSNGDGGGITNYAPGTVTVVNSTISNNVSNTGYGGGGILNFTGTTTIVNSTIADNTNTSFGGRGNAIADAFGGPGAVTLKNTILASTAPGVTCYPMSLAPNSLGHNIATDASCNLAGTGDLNSTNPLLEPLQDNGGGTDTYALATSPLSPAVDLVPGTDCTDAMAVPVTSDQRGIARTQDGDGDDEPACDAGAYEVLALSGNCPYVPSNSCETAASNSISIKVNADPAKSSFAWKWSKGVSAMMQSDFGDPVNGSSRVRLCVYDDRTTVPTFVMAAVVDPGNTCDGNPCWKAVSDKGWAYKNKSGNSNSITKVSFKGGDPTKPQAQLKGKGSNLPLPAAFSPTELFDQDPTLTVQLHTGGPVGCLTSTFDTTDRTKNTNVQFKAKSQ